MGLECRDQGYSSIVATKTKFPLILAEAVILDLKSGVYYGLNDRNPDLESNPGAKDLKRNSGAILEE